MSYLNKYGSKNQRFQGGGVAPAPAQGAASAPAPAPAAGPDGDGDEAAIMDLAQAAVGGDEAAATKLGMILAPMILQEAQAQGGGGQQGAAPEAQPVFQKGGKFLRKV